MKLRNRLRRWYGLQMWGMSMGGLRPFWWMRLIPGFHLCPDWDYMAISVLDSEFLCCTCHFWWRRRKG